VDLTGTWDVVSSLRALALSQRRMDLRVRATEVRFIVSLVGRSRLMLRVATVLDLSQPNQPCLDRSSRTLVMFREVSDVPSRIETLR
jgi:hypothetical protein